MIRKACKDDLQKILAIYNDAILHTTAVYSYQPETIIEREQWYNQKLESGYPVFVCERGGEIAGFATYGAFRDWPAYQYTIEHSIYTDINHRQKGVATDLLQAIIKDATSENYKTIIAGIDATNEGSIRLHQKFNFTHTGTMKNVGYKFERWLDLAFYQFMIDQPQVEKACE
ncbi:GNAT family N-acetyltransferase [Geomicrobium sp. JCM 19038]|uniref:GNAT family N-acetyltransferase n=1 Tax=Geomicrobium sp. JCM 19038 TaxID=1460635 RepID=UPI00045F1262|nr:GNAT family N-acetyltransferase [Geomicrobium sp. JCM 19038]GAK09431.1 phosphinothricin N-acetyltransferase [Geomicrobium sp. JCM 19038]